MSSVWDDPEIGDEELTPLPEIKAAAEAVPVALEPAKLEALAAQIIEKVAREIVPDIAERLIREQLERLMQEPDNG